MKEREFLTHKVIKLELSMKLSKTLKLKVWSIGRILECYFTLNKVIYQNGLSGSLNHFESSLLQYLINFV